MTVASTKHRKVSALADEPDTTLVRPSDWNANHDLWDGTRTISATTDIVSHADHRSLLIFSSATAPIVTIPAPAGSNMPLGWKTRIQRVASTTAMTINGSGGALFNGAATWPVAAGETVELFARGSVDYAVTSSSALLAPYAPLASPVFTGNPSAPTPTAGDNDTSLATTAFVQTAVGGVATAGVTPQAGYLQFVSGTQIKFAPKNGDKIKIAGNLYSIPAAGITSANTGVRISGTPGQNLAANAAYLVSLRDVSGTPTFDFWPVATGHSPDTTAGNVGVEVITGTSCSIIGLLLINSSAQFYNNFYTLSWFNRRSKSNSVPIGNLSTTSTTLVPLGTPLYFLCWADDLVTINMWGQAGDDSTYGQIAIGMDGVIFQSGTIMFIYGLSGSIPFPFSLIVIDSVATENAHGAQLMAGALTGGTIGISNSYLQVVTKG